MWLGSPLKRQCLGTGKNPLTFALRIQTCRNCTDTLASFHTYPCLPCKEIQHKLLIDLIHIWCVLHSLHGFILIFPNTHTHTRSTFWSAHSSMLWNMPVGRETRDGALRRAYVPASLSIPLPIFHPPHLAAQATGSHFSTDIVIAPSALCSFSFRSCNTFIFRLI